MSTTQADAGKRYEIVVGKQLGGRSASAFQGFEITDVPDDGSLMRTSVLDQAALHGVLGRIRDLGIPLVSVRPMTEDGPATLPPASDGVRRPGIPGSGDEVSGEAE